MKRENLTKQPSRVFIDLPAEQKSTTRLWTSLHEGLRRLKSWRFGLHPETQRVRDLLDRNAADELTEEEAAELERFGELEHLMQLVKARAEEYLKTKA